MGGTGNLISRLLTLAAALTAISAAADPAAWRVVGPNGSEIVLLGSVHYLRERDYPLPASLERMYERADHLVMELDLDDIDPAQVQGEFLRAAMLPEGGRLSELMDGNLYRQASIQGNRYGIDLGLLDRFEPWLVAITMLDLGMGQLGFRAERGVEQYFVAKAARDGKEIFGLESLATQVAVFDGLTFDEQQSLLAQTLNELDAAEDAMGTMVDAWRAGSLDTLADSLMSEFDEFPGLYGALVTNRNAAWVNEIERLLRDGSNYLIVVGALHLVGDDSVLEMLEEHGYRTEAFAEVAE